jgi:hypothetical protein
MRRLLVISAVAALVGTPGFALADPGDPGGTQQSGCISTGCKTVYDPGDLPPGFEFPSLPPPDVCMELVNDDTIPEGQPQWDGCILP